MITLSRSLIRRLRLAFNRSLGITKRSAAPAVQFLTGPDGLTVQCLERDVGIAFRQPGEFPAMTFAVPFEFLKDLEGTKDDPVTLELTSDNITARWSDAGIPQTARTDVVEGVEFPPLPAATMQPNPPELMDALRDAVEVTDPESLRYALGCLRLRGSEGQIAASDGSQLLVQNGWQFPWEGDLLACHSRAFGSPHIRSGEPVEIGATENWVTLCTGPWTIHLRIEKEVRFPDVDPHVPQPAAVNTTLHLSECDALFLAEAVKKLPGEEECYSPITLDLNGHVALRARSDGQPTTELILTNSRFDGEPVCLSTNRERLTRAVRYGFREFLFRGPEAPACCRDDRRAYVWAVLDKEGITPPDQDAVRVESPAAATASTTSNHHPRKERPKTMKTSTRTSRNGKRKVAHTAAERPQHPAGEPDLLEQIDQLRQTLRQAMIATKTIATGLKRQRQKSKRLRAAMSSLRQLQSLDA